MLTDLLEISELVELLHNNHQSTESNLEGPTYVPNAPERRMNDRIGVDENGTPLFLSGSVIAQYGSPIANAVVDVWQPNSQGFYDIQDSTQPKR